MTYSIAIVAHPSRSTLANGLGLSVRADAVCWDTTTVGCEENHLQAWRYLADSGDDWGVVLEDDTYVVDGFRDQLKQVLTYAPSPVVSLYLGRGHPHGGESDWQNRIAAKIATDVCWLTAESLLSGQGYAIATTLIPDMLATVTPLALEMPIDEAISWWCQERNILVAHCRPSIVNHRDETPLIQTRMDGQPRDVERVAWLFDWRDKWDDSTSHLTSLRAVHLPAD
jgi:GR25 family glycosyltransferase involved in LPS biosynthesis